MRPAFASSSRRAASSLGGRWMGDSPRKRVPSASRRKPAKERPGFSGTGKAEVLFCIRTNAVLRTTGEPVHRRYDLRPGRRAATFGDSKVSWAVYPGKEVKQQNLFASVFQ